MPDANGPNRLGTDTDKAAEEVGVKLDALEYQRSKLVDQIKESQAVLEAIEDKIEMVKRQSQERLLKDDRVDNRLVMRAHGQESKEDSNFRLMTHVNRSNANTERPTALIPRELTEEEITVRPKEQDNTTSTSSTSQRTSSPEKD